MKINKTYFSILKSTTFFGGVQIIQIILQLIRSKFIAILLGPSGIGFFGLVTSALTMLESLTNFGIATSSVKTIANVSNTSSSQLGRTLGLVKRLIIITGIFGTFVTIIISPLLSNITFGSFQYTNVFLILSCTIFMNQIYAGNIAFLQGIRANKLLGTVTLIGNIVSLLFVIPLYYFYGLNGIVSGIIVNSLIICLFSTWVVKRKNIELSKIPLRDVFNEGRQLIVTGLMISLGGVLALSVSYFVRIFINGSDGFNAVGLYNSGFVIINTYVGLVFTAMSLDYFPRLSGVSDNLEKIKELVNQQSEVAILILAPLIGVFVLCVDWITIILYSESFLPVVPMLFWAALGIFFKSTAWSMGYIFLAKGDNKVFFVSELMSNLLILIFSIVGYRLMKFQGVGLGFLFSYVLNSLQIYLICHFRYGFRFHISFVKLFFIQLVLVTVIMLITFYLQGLSRYLLGGAILLVIILLSVSFVYNNLSIRSMFIYKKNSNKT